MQTTNGGSRGGRRITRNEARDFYAMNHEKAVRYANAILKDVDLSEDAVALTYQELIAGKTTPGQFFHALRSNALNLLGRSRSADARVTSLTGLRLKRAELPRLADPKGRGNRARKAR